MQALGTFSYLKGSHFEGKHTHILWMECWSYHSWHIHKFSGTEMVQCRPVDLSISVFIRCSLQWNMLISQWSEIVERRWSDCHYLWWRFSVYDIGYMHGCMTGLCYLKSRKEDTSTSKLHVKLLAMRISSVSDYITHGVWYIYNSLVVKWTLSSLYIPLLLYVVCMKTYHPINVPGGELERYMYVVNKTFPVSVCFSCLFTFVACLSSMYEYVTSARCTLKYLLSIL